MPRTTPRTLTCGLLLAAALTSSSIAQTTPSRAVLPTGMGEAIDRALSELRESGEYTEISEKWFGQDVGQP